MSSWHYDCHYCDSPSHLLVCFSSRTLLLFLFQHRFFVCGCGASPEDRADGCMLGDSARHGRVSEVSLVHNLSSRYIYFIYVYVCINHTLYTNIFFPIIFMGKFTSFSFSLCIFVCLRPAVFSRVWVVWAVMHVAPPAQTSIFTVLTIVSWSLVEIPRYSFYALNLVNAVPYPLFWLRYRSYIYTCIFL